MSNIYSLVDDIKKKLSTLYTDPHISDQYAWWILQSITGTNQTNLIKLGSTILSKEQQNKLDDWIVKLVDYQMPLAYLLGSVPFNDIDILVYPPVFIPRPETEEWTVNLIQQLQQLGNSKLTILDMCTGSGCIAIALAHALPDATIYATDIADHAIECTTKNIVHNKVRNVTVIKSDLFVDIPENLKFDLIVANPPYIDPSKWATLEPSVTRWEDKHALTASDEGLWIIERIIKNAPHYIQPNTSMALCNIAQLILEIDVDQGARVRSLFENAGYCNIAIDKDLEGKDRVAHARVVPCGYLHT